MENTNKSHKYLDFEDARDVIRSLKFKSRKEFRDYLKDNNIKNIPSNPSYTYRNEWISLYDWIGKDKKSLVNNNCLTYKKALDKVHNIITKDIKSAKDWVIFYEKNLNLMHNIPKYPNVKYKDYFSWSEWLNIVSKSDFLGKKIELEYDEYIKIIKEYIINNRKDYHDLCKSLRNIGIQIPTNPCSVYNIKWKDIPFRKKKKSKYLPYNESLKMVKSWGLKSQKEWYSYCKENKIPKNVPKTPNKEYKDEWVSWNEWLGHNITTNKKFISYEKAKDILRRKNIQSMQEYYDFIITEKIDFLPIQPSTYYGSEYKSISDFLPSVSNISYGERKIIKTLNNESVEYIHQHKFDNCVDKKKLIFDFYLPEINLCIEFDGQQHFKPIEFFGGEESFLALKRRDRIKNNYCEENKIKLLRISYEDVNIIDILIKSKIKSL